MTKREMTGSTALHGTAFRIMGGGTSGAGWQRPGPVFAPEDGGGSGGGSEPTAEEKLAAAEARVAAAEREKADLLKESMKRKDEIKTLKDGIAKFDGIDPDAVKKLLADKAESDKAASDAEEKRLVAAGDFDKLKKQMADAHAEELRKQGEQTEAERNRLASAQRTIVELTVGSAFANSTFLRDETLLTPAKARKVFGDHFEVEDGVIKAYDRERGDTERKPLVDGSGKPLSFEDAMRRIVDADPEKDRLLKSGGKSGSGKQPSGKDTGGKDKQEVPSGLGRIAAGLAALNKG